MLLGHLSRSPLLWDAILRGTTNSVMPLKPTLQVHLFTNILATAHKHPLLSLGP